MGPFLAKDLLILWRDRKDMVLSLITPVIIVLVLGYTTSSWIEKSNDTLQMTVAIVSEDNETAGLAQFRESLFSSSISEKALALLSTQAEQLMPVHLLGQILNSVEFVKIIELDDETARQHLHDEEITAIITIPEHFTQTALNKMLLNVGNGAALSLTADNHSSLRVDVLQDVLNGFTQTLNLQTAIDLARGEPTESLVQAETTASYGGRETVEGVAMLTSFQYYAIAISIMFAMFVSSGSAMKAITEKREQVFQRILLSGSHPLRYLAGKVGSTFVIAWMQLSVLILLSHFIFNLFPGRSLHFWLGMALITIMFSLTTAALSAMFTSLSFRVNDAAANGLFTLILGVLGTIGGSFVPLYILPDWLKQVGEWTPNGLALSVFIQWIQEDSLTLLPLPFLKLVIFTIAIIMLGSWIFPRRGRI